MILINFRIEMEVYSDHVENFENISEKVKSDEKITDLDLEIKIEKPDIKENIKAEYFGEENNSESLQIIGEKRKNNQKSNLEVVNKKIKEEFVVFEELDNKKEPRDIEENNLDFLNTQVL